MKVVGGRAFLNAATVWFTATTENPRTVSPFKRGLIGFVGLKRGLNGVFRRHCIASWRCLTVGPFAGAQAGRNRALFSEHSY